jgi:ceramide glucosyltransferase
LRENLESLFHLDYPEYEILFSVDHAADPAVEIVQDLRHTYPHIPTRLMVSNQVFGPNPKVNNMVHAYHQAEHNLVLISDSNARLRNDFLAHMVTPLNPKVGVVTAIITGTHAKSLMTQVESSFLHSYYARGMALAKFFRVPAVMGKAMLFRRSDLDRVGGMTAFLDHMAEDYMIGKTMAFLGLEVKICQVPVQEILGTKTVGQFWNRHLRWGRLRKAYSLPTFLLEPLLYHQLSAGILGVISAAFLSSSTRALQVGLIHLILWLGLDMALMVLFTRKLREPMLLAWLIKELISLWLWPASLLGNSISWRKQAFHVAQGGTTITIRVHGRPSSPHQIGNNAIFGDVPA